MRFKSLLAVAIGVGAVALGIWRLSSGETRMGVVACLVGVFLLFRGVTGTVRQGL